MLERDKSRFLQLCTDSQLYALRRHLISCKPYVHIGFTARSNVFDAAAHIKDP